MISANVSSETLSENKIVNKSKSTQLIIVTDNCSTIKKNIVFLINVIKSYSNVPISKILLNFFKPQEVWRPIWRVIFTSNPENVKEEIHRLVEESMEPKVIQISAINKQTAIFNVLLKFSPVVVIGLITNLYLKFNSNIP